MNRKTDKPNVLFIMSDQHRFDYVETHENAPEALSHTKLTQAHRNGS